MKAAATVLALACFLIACQVSMAGELHRETAEWIDANMHALDGKVVAVRVCSVSVGSTANGRTTVYAHTRNKDGAYGGGIGVSVPDAQLARFVRDFGARTTYVGGKAKTRRLSALMRIVNGSPLLIVD